MSESARARVQKRRTDQEIARSERERARARARRERETKNDYLCMHVSNAETEEADL